MILVFHPHVQAPAAQLQPCPLPPQVHFSIKHQRYQGGMVETYAGRMGSVRATLAGALSTLASASGRSGPARSVIMASDDGRRRDDNNILAVIRASTSHIVVVVKLDLRIS